MRGMVVKKKQYLDVGAKIINKDVHMEKEGR